MTTEARRNARERDLQILLGRRDKLDMEIKKLEKNKELEMKNKELEMKNKKLDIENKELDMKNKELDMENKKKDILIDFLFKISKMNEKYQFRLPILNPTDNRLIAVDRITNIIDNSPIVYARHYTPITGRGSMGLTVGDIVLLDNTNSTIIHKFSESEKYVIVNLPTELYRESNPSYPMKQVDDSSILGIIRELYKAFCNY